MTFPHSGQVFVRLRERFAFREYQKGLARNQVLVPLSHQRTKNPLCPISPDRITEAFSDDNSDAARRVIVIYAGYPEPMKKLLNSDPGYKRRVKHNFTLPDYTPFELAQIFLKKAEDLGRGIGDDVTAEEIGKLINKHTTAQYRSDRNGSVAEDLRSAAEEAMCNRLRPHFEKLAYEWVDVEAGAQALSEAE